MQRQRRPGQRQRGRTPRPGPDTGTGTSSSGEAARPVPRERKPLAEMTAQERADWYGAHQAELEDFATYAQEWAMGRARRGMHNWNDERYAQFFSQAADLLAGLEELRQGSRGRSQAAGPGGGIEEGRKKRARER